MQASSSAPRSLSRKEQRVVDTRLLNAVEDGNLKQIKQCLKDGANINTRDNEGLTALHIAVDNKNSVVVKFLLENGASRDIKNNHNETPSDIAVRLNETGIIQLLNPQLLIPKSSQQKLKLTGEGVQQRKKVGSAIHGHIYQLKLLMLFLHRGVLEKYSFRLGTEIKEAKKFDDLLFEYIECGLKIYRLLQAKHRLDETKKITSNDLLSVGKNDFSLVKFFFSYMQAKKDSFFKNGTIKDVILSTNIGFDLADLKVNGIEIQQITSFDNILCEKSGSRRYRFSNNLVSKLKWILIKKKQITRTKWFNIYITDEGVQDFLNHLVFAVNQPNEEELGEIIKNEIGEKLDLDSITTENTYNKLFIKMLNWLQGKESGRFLSCEEGEEFFKQAKRGMPFLFNIKDPVSSFTGRVEQLNALHEALMKDDNSVVISGLGGVGKSELARKYISLHSQNYDDKVLWMNAENYSSLSESFHRLALDKLGINTKNVEGKAKDIKSLVEDVFRFFSEGNCLFVFDNAESFKDGIKEFLPSLPKDMSRPHILITSRNQKWPNNMRVSPLDVFSETEALEVIQNSLNIAQDAKIKDIKKLAKKLQFFPLALQQAVAYIKLVHQEKSNVGSEFTVTDYLEKFKQKAKELLDFSFPEDSDANYSKTTYTTWEVTLDHIKERENGVFAIEIMNLIAYFAPENIRTEIFFGLIKKEKLGSSLELLKQYSMISLEQATFHVHRLVQQITRLKLLNQNLEESLLRKALKLFKNNEQNSKYVDHAIYVWNHSSTYEKLIKEFHQVTKSICFELMQQARFQEVYLFGKKVSKLLRSCSLDNDTILDSLFRANGNMAEALQHQGKLDKAQEVLQELYRMQGTFLGPNHLETLKTKRNIAHLLNSEGKYNEALTYAQDVFDVYQIQLDEHHPEMLSMKYQIAYLMIQLGRTDSASKLLQEVLENQEATLKENDPETLQTKRSIADVLSAEGKYDEALKIAMKIHDIQESTLGNNNSHVLKSKFQIGTLYFKQGKFSQALTILQEVLDLKKKLLGNDHPAVLATRFQIAEVLQEQGNYDEALKIFRDVLRKQKNTLGQDHLAVLGTTLSIAHVQDAQGQDSDALQAYEEVLSKLKDQNDHPKILVVSNSIAALLSKQGKHDEALQYYWKILNIQNKTLGENHPDSLCTRYIIGMSLYDKKEYNGALQIFRRVSSGFQASMPDHPTALLAKTTTGMILCHQEKHDEALKIFREVLDSEETNCKFGKNHLNEILATKNHIADTLKEKKRFSEALRMYREVFEGRTKIYGPEHPDTLKIGKVIEVLSAAINDLLMAVKNNNVKKLETLVKNGDVNAMDDNNTSLLHHAVNGGNIKTVNLLLKLGADITQINNEGTTPLHIATSKCHRKILGILLQHAKKLAPIKLHDFINAKTIVKGAVALHIAAEKDDLKIVKLLLQSGAKYNVKNKEDRTPSEVATSNEIKVLFDSVDKLFEYVEKGNKTKIGQLLTEKEVVINARNANGATALFCAVQNRFIDITQLLLENGADPTLVTDKGNTSLHLASQDGNNKLVKALIDKVKKDAPQNLNSFIDTQTTVGQNAALHVASNVEVVTILLKCGAIYNPKNKDGKTPLDTAKNNAIKEKLISIDKQLAISEKTGDTNVTCLAGQSSAMEI